MGKQDQIVNLSLSGDSCLTLIAYMENLETYVVADDDSLEDVNLIRNYISYFEQAYGHQATSGGVV